MRENTADLRLDLRDACRRLTARQREVVALTVDGYTQREIGERMGIAHQVVSQHWAAALAILEQSLN